MGEYALYGNERIKIGTCEEMYYLRADQRFQVRHEPGNVDPVRDVAEIRFRFPWPDEDREAPGAFTGGFERSVVVPDSSIPLPEGVEHGTVQFLAERPGDVVSLPCPEAEPSTPGLDTMLGGLIRVGRNGFRGRLHLVQQRWQPETGHWVAIARCGGCESKFRYPDWAGVAPLVLAFLEEEQRRGGGFYRAIAERLAAGYGRTVAGEETDVQPA